MVLGLIGTVKAMLKAVTASMDNIKLERVGGETYKEYEYILWKRAANPDSIVRKVATWGLKLSETVTPPFRRPSDVQVDFEQVEEGLIFSRFIAKVRTPAYRR